MSEQESRSAMNDAKRPRILAVLQAYANDNPKWTDLDNITHDPNGVHALLAELAAPALPRETVPHRATIAIVPCPSCAFQGAKDAHERFVVEKDSVVVWFDTASKCGTESEANAKAAELRQEFSKSNMPNVTVSTGAPAAASPPIWQEAEVTDFSLDKDQIRSLAGEAAQPPDEVAIRWIEAIQGAIGNMGRLGDRDYFTFAMWLVFEQAENDGLIPRDSRTKSEIDRLRPIIDEKKKILCLTPPVASAQDDEPISIKDWNLLLLEICNLYALVTDDEDWKYADVSNMEEFDPWYALKKLRAALSPAQAAPPTKDSGCDCGSLYCGEMTLEKEKRTSEPSAQAVAGQCDATEAEINGGNHLLHCPYSHKRAAAPEPVAEPSADVLIGNAILELKRVGWGGSTGVNRDRAVEGLLTTDSQFEGLRKELRQAQEIIKTLSGER